MRISKKLEKIRQQLLLITDLIIDQASKDPKIRKVLTDAAMLPVEEQAPDKRKSKKEIQYKKNEVTSLALLSVISDFLVEKSSRNRSFGRKIKVKKNQIKVGEIRKSSITKNSQVHEKNKIKVTDLEPTISVYERLGEESFMDYMTKMDDEQITLICKKELGLKISVIKKIPREEKIQLIIDSVTRQVNKGHCFLK